MCSLELKFRLAVGEKLFKLMLCSGVLVALSAGNNTLDELL